MPSITPANALIKAADNLVDTISGLMPQNSVTADAVEQLMEIYKIQAEKVTCKAQLKGCSVSKRKLKGWRNNSWQRVKKQAHSTARHHSPILK